MTIYSWFGIQTQARQLRGECVSPGHPVILSALKEEECKVDVVDFNRILGREHNSYVICHFTELFRVRLLEVPSFGWE